MTNNRVPILIENLSHSLDYLNKIKEYYDLNDLEHDSKELLSISLKKYQEMCKKALINIEDIIENDEITEEYNYNLIKLKDTISPELERINYIVERVENLR